MTLLTLALCWRIARADGVVIALTSHDQDLVVEGCRYRAAPSLAASALSSGISLEAGSMDVSGALSHGVISADDLAAGRYDGARVSLWQVDWADPDAPPLYVAGGTLGAVRQDGEAFSATLDGPTAALSNPVVELTTPTCRAQLGDARCKVNLRLWRVLGSVTAVLAPDQVQVSGLPSTGWASGGVLRWLSGPRTGLDADILTDTNGVLTLVVPAAVSVGTRVEITAGCDKRFVTCRTRFGNGANFRGEPVAPGLDSAVRYGTR
jgi:uncharacterized phage protein (TIGR02218 family)